MPFSVGPQKFVVEVDDGEFHTPIIPRVSKLTMFHPLKLLLQLLDFLFRERCRRLYLTGAHLSPVAGFLTSSTENDNDEDLILSSAIGNSRFPLVKFFIVSLTSFILLPLHQVSMP